MSNAFRMLVVVIIGVMLFNVPLQAEGARPIGERYLKKIVEFADLIIEGVIIDKESKLVDLSEISNINTSSHPSDWVVTELTIEIERLIAGEYDDKIIKMILKEGEYQGLKSHTGGYELLNPEISDRIIVGLVHNAYQSNNYTLFYRVAFFKVDNDCDLVPYMKEAYIDVDNPLEIIEREAKERSFEEMYRNADLVCIGEVTYSNEAYRKQKVNVQEILKGELEKPEITIDGANLFKSYYKKEPGYRVLLFLAKKDDEYITLAGINGYYAIENDALIRSHHTSLKASLTGMKEKMNKWKQAY